LHTHVAARWIGLRGYASAAFLLVGRSWLDRVLLVFPCWVLVVRIYIPIDKVRPARQTMAAITIGHTRLKGRSQ
jgi:hypothetical protein